MCLLWGTHWVFISQKAAFFIVTAVKTSDLTKHWPAEFCSGEVMFPVRYELGSYIPEDGILQVCDCSGTSHLTLVLHRRPYSLSLREQCRLQMCKATDLTLTFLCLTELWHFRSRTDSLRTVLNQVERVMRSKCQQTTLKLHECRMNAARCGCKRGHRSCVSLVPHCVVSSKLNEYSVLHNYIPHIQVLVDPPYFRCRHVPYTEM
jgi:hypothetical protein